MTKRFPDLVLTGCSDPRSPRLSTRGEGVAFADFRHPAPGGRKSSLSNFPRAVAPGFCQVWRAGGLFGGKVPGYVKRRRRRRVAKTVGAIVAAAAVSFSLLVALLGVPS